VTALCPGGVKTELVKDVPGASPLADRLDPETVAETVRFLLELPNTASVAELVVNTRVEPTI
jgi:NADP-dependent 3-hydroxy acid dehydrogenase YdfG